MCGQGMVYSSCDYPCEASCNDLEGEMCDDTSACVEGCFCEEGLVLDGDGCIEPEQCGCEEDGLYYSVSSTTYICS